MPLSNGGYFGSADIGLPKYKAPEEPEPDGGGGRGKAALLLLLVILGALFLL